MREKWKKDKKFRIKIILAAAVLLILIGASVYTVFIKPSLNTETYVYKEEEVRCGDLILGIMESGSLTLGESYIEYDLDLDLDDDSDSDSDDSDEEEEEDTRYLEIEEAYVVSGQRINQGDVLFKLTDDSVNAVRRKLSAALSEAQIALSEAQTDYNISLYSAKSTYDSSVIAGNRAQTDYQAALSQSSEAIRKLEGEIALLELEISQAQEMLSDEDFLESITEAELAYTRAKNIYDETDVHNTTAYVSNLSDYQEAEEAYEKLKDQKQEYQDTITDNQAEIEKKKKEIEEAQVNQILSNQEAENNYNSAKLEGELAEEIYGYTLDSFSETVTQAQTDYDELQSLMDAFEAFVGEDNQIYASESGLVINVMYEAGDDLEEAGIMLTYATEDNYTISIDVSEEDVAAVAVGDTVDIDFAAYPDQTWQGTITAITTSATAEHASTISYPITIAVEGDTGLLYGGMTADVTFVTDSVSDVLYVSKKAVFEENGVSYVYRKTEQGDMEKAIVETGFEDMASVEIISGLSEGDVIYIKSIINTETTFSDDGGEETENTSGGSDQVSDKMEFEGGFEFPDNGNFGGEMPNGGGTPENWGGGRR
ncbi:MAG: HlyD family efflux transporter periplasmic adaptor subunit [Bacillota bacterium]|nr:HlyD family efflux transporter periplasmic adaptor subunit [Bacillota bacterium]